MKNALFRIVCVLLVATCLLACTEDKKKIKIVCWGDSLTAPHCGTSLKGQVKKFIKGDDSWPGVLEEMLGSEYEVVNCGVGGETSLTIMARQGSAPMALAHNVIVYDSGNSEFKNFIGNSTIPAFFSTWGGKSPDLQMLSIVYCDSVESSAKCLVAPLLQSPWEEGSYAHVNPVKLGDRMFDIVSEAKFWTSDNEVGIPLDESIKTRKNKRFIFEYNYFLKNRKEQNFTDTIKAGTIVETEAMRTLRNADVNVFFVGQNGGFKSISEYIAQIRAMIDYSQTREYLVISFHKPNNVLPTPMRMKDMEDSLTAAFGLRFIPLRQMMVDHGLASAGFVATKEDEDSIAYGQVPPQLMTDGCHFVPEGYRYIAELVFEKLKSMQML